jgi:hypothetical protein
VGHPPLDIGNLGVFKMSPSYIRKISSQITFRI